MKKRVSLLLVVAMLLSMLPVMVSAAEPEVLLSVTNESVTAEGYTYEYTAETAGTLNVTVGTCSPGWQYRVTGPNYDSGTRGKYTAGPSCDYAVNETGVWTIRFYAYSSAEAGSVAGTVSFTLTFTPDQGGEVEKVAYEVADTELALGDNTLTLLDTAVTTIYKFEAPETAVYTFTAPEGATLGYWGAGSWFLSDPKSTTNTYEWTCTGVGQSAYIGVSGVEGEFNLNVAKTGEYTVVETPIIKYENKATLATWEKPEGATWGSYVDVYGETHTAVLGDDGYYHLDSADGDVLVVNLKYQDIILSAALNSDRPVMYAYMYNEDGQVEYKYDIGDAVKEYEAVMDESGYYPVTEDILLFYQVYAVQVGTFTFHLTGDYNKECVWMYCMRTMNMDNVEVDPDPEEPTDPSEPETDPSEPEQTTPSEPVSGEIVFNESVTADSGSKKVITYTPAEDGTLNITIGDGSTSWESDLRSVVGLTFTNIATAKGSAQQSYSAQVTGGTKYQIRVWATSGALAETPVLAVFTPVGGTTPEPSEPETEPSEPETEPSEPETEPSEPETEPSEPETEPSVPSVPDENVPAGTKYALVSGSDVTYYSSATAGSINNVIKAAPVGAMIILYDDIDLGTSSTCFEVYTGSEIILDLNGHTMTYSYANIGTVYVDGGKLTVQDSSAEGTGMITSTHKNGVAIEVHTGTLIFEGGNASSKIGAKVWANASMTMAGGSISGSQYAVNALANSAVTVSGGELVQSTAGSFNYSLYAAGTATMSITGGYFNGNVSGAGLNGKISGGYYTAAVSAAYIASGYERQANDDATYIYKVVDPNATETEPSEPTVPTEPVKDAYAVSTTVLSVGSNTVSMIETAEATLFKFTPAEAGTYIITGPEGSKVGIWGLSSNVKDPNSTSNSCELTLANAGPTARVGVTGAEGQIVLTITKYEEPIDPSEPDQTEPSEPVESGTLLTVTNEAVTADGYIYTFHAETTGTLNVTVGECSPGWQYKVIGPNYDSGNRGKYTAGDTCDYEVNEAGEWKVLFYAYTSAEGRMEGTVSFTLTFTPDEQEVAGPQELVSVTNEAVTADGYTYTFHAETTGTLNVTVGECSPGWQYKVIGPNYDSGNRGKYTAGDTCDYEVNEAGEWKVLFYAYTSAEGRMEGTVSFTLTFTPDQGGGEVEKAEHEISETELVLGDNTLTLLDTAVTTIYVFKPAQTGVYTFTAPAGAILGYWGAGSWFLSNPNSTTNTYEWTCTGVGQTAYIGVSGVDGEFKLNVAKTGDYTVVVTPIVKYENKATLETFTLPEGATLGGYVDVFGETHTAVLGEDGYYHLDSVDGPILLIDMDYMDIILSAALQSDRPVMYAYMYDEDGNETLKYDIGDAVKAYEAVMDENGYYPVTEDILLFYQVYAMQAGTFTFHLTGSYNEECVWMYCMRTVTMPDYVAAVYANGEQIAQYTTVADAIAACTEGQYVVLITDVTEDITVTGNVYLDLNGKTITGNVTGEGTLYAMDSATDDYDCTDMGRITGTVSCTVATVAENGTEKYLAIKDELGYSFHHFYVGITAVSLKPSVVGFGYKAVFSGDAMVQQQLASFGFDLWLDEGTVVTREKNADQFVSGKVVTLRLQNFDADNFGEAPVNAQVFMKLTDGTVLSSAVSTYTLRDVVEQINASADTYEEEQLTAVANMIMANATMQTWDVSNILPKEEA